MFERILVPLDGSPLAERALPVAALIARSTGATVVLLHAASIELEYGPYFAQATAFVETALETEIDSANAYLELIASSETLAGIKTEKADVLGHAPRCPELQTTAPMCTHRDKLFILPCFFSPLPLLDNGLCHIHIGDDRRGKLQIEVSGDTFLQAFNQGSQVRLGIV